MLRGAGCLAKQVVGMQCAHLPEIRRIEVWVVPRHISTHRSRSSNSTLHNHTKHEAVPLQQNLPLQSCFSAVVLLSPGTPFFCRYCPVYQSMAVYEESKPREHVNVLFKGKRGSRLHFFQCDKIAVHTPVLHWSTWLSARRPAFHHSFHRRQ